MREIFKTYAKPTLLFLGILLIVFFPVIFQGGEIFGVDIRTLDDGLIYYVFDSLKKGFYPHILMNLSSGIPFASAYPSIFYPTMWFYFFFDYSTAFAFSIVLNYLIAFIGVYAVGQYFKLNKYACFIGGLIFSINGYSFESQGQQTMVFANAWIPWLFLYANKLIDNLSLKNTILMFLISILSISTGRMDYLYFTHLFIFLWFFLSLLLKKRSIKDKKLNFTFLITIQFTSLLIMSFILLPLFDYLQQSLRSDGVQVEEAVKFAFEPVFFPSFIFDEFYGNKFYASHLFNLISDIPLFGAFYIGIVAFVLLIYSLTYLKKSNESKIIFILLVIFFLLATGKYLNEDLYLYLYFHFPFLKNMRYPVKFISIVMFCISLLSMFSLDFINKNSDKDEIKIFKFTLILITIFSLIFIYMNYFDAGLKKTIPIIYDIKKNIEIWDTSPIYRSYNKTFMFLFVFFILVFSNNFKLIDRRFFIFLITLISSIEIISVSSSNLLYLNKGFYSKKPAFVTEIEKNIGNKKLYRVFSNISVSDKKIKRVTPSAFVDTELKVFNSLLYNKNLNYDLKSFSGVYISHDKALNNLLHYIQDKPLFLSKYASEYEYTQILKINAIKYVIFDSDDKFSEKYFTLIASQSKFGINLWEVKSPEPIYTFKTKSAVFKSKDGIFELFIKMGKYKLDFSKVVFLLDDDNYKKAINNVKKEKSNNGYNNDVTLLDENTSGVKLEVKNNESGYVVLANHNYKNWKAYDNDKEIPILTANADQQALRIPPGQHIIRMEYYPEPLYNGIKLSFLGIILMLGQCFFVYKLNRKNKSI